MKNMELEIKYLLGEDDLKKTKNIIDEIDGVSKIGRFYEKTTMFDNDSKIMDKKDARLRVREIKNTKENGKIYTEFSYKRRIQAAGGIKKEEEVELSFDGYTDKLYKILQEMNFIPTTSYERYRETYMTGDGTKITLDEFPFGYILEIEGSEENIKKYNSKLNLETKNSYPLSCDDAYVELCKQNNLVPKDHILFSDLEMPHIK